MDNAQYKFKTLENKYDGFLAPSIELVVGSKRIDTSKIPVSMLSVDIDASNKAGGCQFTIESQFDYESSRWDNGLLNAIKVGEKIIVKAGYTKREEVFFGFVDDFSVEYSADAAPRITVNGIDAKGYLMNAKDRKFMSEKPTATVVKEILGECVSRGYAKSITVGSMVDFDAQLIQEEIDDYKFLCYLAEMFNMCFVVIDGEIVFENLMAQTKPVITLDLGVSLLSFSKKVSLRSQVGKVVVYGIDPKTHAAISGEATDTSFGGGGQEAGDMAQGFNTMVEKETNYFVHTPEECQKLAQARFDARAFSFVNGQGRCIGLPELIPGRYITLSGFDNQSADSYFISKVTHEYSADNGFYTTFDVKGAKSK